MQGWPESPASEAEPGQREDGGTDEGFRGAGLGSKCSTYGEGQSAGWVGRYQHQSGD